MAASILAMPVSEDDFGIVPWKQHEIWDIFHVPQVPYWPSFVTMVCNIIYSKIVLASHLESKLGKHFESRCLESRSEDDNVWTFGLVWGLATCWVALILSSYAKQYQCSFKKFLEGMS